MNDAQQLFAKMMEEHGITIHSKFVPFSESRNKDEDLPSLNWYVTLNRHDREVLAVDYTAGMGHCESVDLDGKQIDYWRTKHFALQDAIRAECEDGKARCLNHSKLGYKIRVRRDGTKGETWFTLPDPGDVLYSLLLDGQAIDAGCFEAWADDMGMEQDSRIAHAMYQDCLETGLKLRNAFGETLLGELGDAAQDL